MVGCGGVIRIRGDGGMLKLGNVVGWGLSGREGHPESWRVPLLMVVQVLRVTRLGVVGRGSRLLKAD